MKNYLKICIISFALILICILIVGCTKNKNSFVGGAYNEEKGVNTPKLVSGMTAIKWENGQVIKVNNPEKDSSWYDYKNNKWANAMTEDGSMWVWIPRYAYQIENGYNEADNGKINIVFLKGTTNESTENIVISNKSGEGNWNVHPSFTNAKETLGIGWDCDIEGFWVAKFEAGKGTKESKLRYGTNASRTNEKVNIKGEVINYPAFKDGIASINYTNSNDMFCISKELTVPENPYGFNNEEIESMQITNAQWGAVAYLTYSKYGTNGKELEINKVERNIENETAQTGGENYLTNVKQSSTQNEYGVYDLAGGAWERTAAFLDDNAELLRIYDYQLVKNKDTRYVDKYDTANQSNLEDNYKENKEKYGDAIYEVSNLEKSAAWNGDNLFFPSGEAAVFRKGGNYKDGEKAGIFATYITAGCETNDNSSFRVILINK